MKDRFTKHEFLTATDDFANWLADKWTFLSDTLSKYEWNKKDFNETEEELNNLSDSLKNAFNEKDEEVLKASSINILEWGGVLNKNQDWVKENSMLDLLENVTERWNELNSGENIEKVKDDIRSNAGFTKIYALLLDDFIIYDSRVAAALAYYINEYYTSQNQPIAEYLKFDLPVGRETENTKGRRFVSADFKTFTRDYKRHLRSNVAASWLAQSVIHKIGDKNITVRHLEAALFMIGYDINELPSHEETKDKIENKINRVKITVGDVVYEIMSHLRINGLRDLLDVGSSEYSITDEERIEKVIKICNAPFTFKYIVEGYKIQYKEMSYDHVVSSLNRSLDRLLRLVIEHYKVDLYDYEDEICELPVNFTRSDGTSIKRAELFETILDNKCHEIMDIEYHLADLIQLIIIIKN